MESTEWLTVWQTLSSRSRSVQVHQGCTERPTWYRDPQGDLGGMSGSADHQALAITVSWHHVVLD